MEHISKTLQKRSVINDNNDNKKITNNGINDNPNNGKSKYSLDRSKFVPNTERSQLAEEVADKLNDLQNYAAFLAAVNKHGCSRIRQCLQSTLDDIEEKKKTKTPVRKPGAYFMWKLKNGI